MSLPDLHTSGASSPSPSLPGCLPLLSTATTLTDRIVLLRGKLHPWESEMGREGERGGGTEAEGRKNWLWTPSSSCRISNRNGGEKKLKTNTGLWDQSLTQSAWWLLQRLCHYWTEVGKNKRFNNVMWGKDLRRDNGHHVRIHSL